MRSEKTIENEIKKYLKQAGAYVVKYHGGVFSTSGTPDLLVCYRGRFIALEVKKESGGVVSKLQEFKIEQIQKAGGIAKVVRSVGEVRRIIETI